MSAIDRTTGRRDGYILVAVLGVMVLLTGFLAAGSVLVRSALQAARVGDEEAAMGGLTDGGFELTAYELFVLKLPPPLVNGRRIKFAGGTIAPTVTSESGKVDLNGSRPALLQSELEAAGLDQAVARAVVARIVALRGPDPRAAPSSDGAQPVSAPGNIFAAPPVTSPPAAGAAARPRGFQSIDSLRTFREIDARAYRLLAPRFTVFNPDGRVDIASATPAVLTAIPGMDKATVDRILVRRTSATKAELENVAASLGTAKDFTKATGGPAYMVRIDAIAADGRKKSVAAIMAAAKSPDIPYYILEWED